MIFSEPIPFDEALQSLKVKSLLPTTASSRQLMALAPDLRERGMFAARVTNTQFLQSIDDQVTSLVRAETDPATVRLRLKETLTKIGYEPDPKKRGTIQDLSSDRRLDLIIDTQNKMADGYGNWMQGQDPAVLDQWPAQELFRAEAREQPREWIGRWIAAGGKLFNGRMIALKNDAIWTRISVFGLPYPPFDFNSGMDVEDVERDEAMRAGLIGRDAQIEPQTRGFNDELQAASPVDPQSNLFQTLLDSLGEQFSFSDGVLQFTGAA